MIVVPRGPSFSIQKSSRHDDFAKTITGLGSLEQIDPSQAMTEKVGSTLSEHPPTMKSDESTEHYLVLWFLRR